MDPDPGGPKTYGSYGSGSATLLGRKDLPWAQCKGAEGVSGDILGRAFAQDAVFLVSISGGSFPEACASGTGTYFRMPSPFLPVSQQPEFLSIFFLFVTIKFFLTYSRETRIRKFQKISFNADF
jgi:hypothetical protein